MNKYNRLLMQVAEQHNIFKGSSEPEDNWKCRLVYSICGLMGYASCWDSSDNEYPSIDHFKNRVLSVCDSYKQLYPELKFILGASQELVDEIYDVLLKSGSLYHLDRHVSPPVQKTCCLGNTLLMRGSPIDHITNVSGLGVFRETSENDDSPVSSLFEMFQIDPLTLTEKWETTLQNASWESKKIPPGAKYLNTEFSSERQYWVRTRNKTIDCSLLQIPTETRTLYYLYKKDDTGVYTSSLADWETYDTGIRVFSNACLAANNCLPPIKYWEDGEIVFFKPGYLLPPAESSFLKLYSWPTDFTNITSPFQKRACSALLFQSIIDELSSKGYQFTKE